MAYATEADIEAYLGESFTESTVPTSDFITDSLARAKAQIDKETGTAFESTTVTDSIFNAVTMEYEGYIALKMPKKPIVSVTSFYVDEAGLGSSSTSWVARTEGRTSSYDYVLIGDDGLLVFHHDQPSDGLLNVKSTYVYGYSAVPADVEKLTILLVVRDILRARIADSTYSSADNITVGPISISKASSSASVGVKELQAEIDDLWKSVGRFRTLAY